MTKTIYGHDTIQYNNILLIFKKGNLITLGMRQVPEVCVCVCVCVCVWWGKREDRRYNFKSAVVVLVAEISFIQFNLKYFRNFSSLTPNFPLKIM